MTKFFPKLRRAQKGEINYPFMDRFTLAHFVIGVIYGYLGLEFWLVIILAVAWELIENPLKAYAPFIFPHPSADTLQNSLGDCAAVIFGWGVMRWIMPHFNLSPLL